MRNEEGTLSKENLMKKLGNEACFLMRGQDKIRKRKVFFYRARLFLRIRRFSLELIKFYRKQLYFIAPYLETIILVLEERIRS